MGKILITGASGFIGKRLLEVFCDEYGDDNIIALTSEKPNRGLFLNHHNYSFPKDFFLASGFDDIETIIHAGAFTPKQSNEANSWEETTSNISNTFNLITATLPILKKFIFLSTLDVYEIVDGPISEDSSTSPISLYGASKLYCERMLQQWAVERGVSCLVLRVGHVYGPGEQKYKKLIPLVMNNLLRNESPQIFGNGKELRSFIFIDDVANAILAMAKMKEYDSPINIAGSKPVSVSELVNTIIDIANQNVQIDYKEGNTVSRNLVFNTAKMQRLINITETPLRKGLEAEWQFMSSL
ncbi:MAG: NAD-dependent epimerase/dehydratase family protein [Bacteroidetes bacterium]|nr:NAD-dependent epimerase/dehydratase family protein [Bacteroidota bacterium]